MAGMGQRERRTLTPISTPNLSPPSTTMDQARTTTMRSPSPLSPLLQGKPSPAASSPPPPPQWSHQETLELIAIRGELERDFSASKRNKSLWETVATRMRERGFSRTPHQCKCKWKNLLIRYKGKETSDPINEKQCPYFEELHAIFSERAKAMQQTLMESRQVSDQPRKRMKKTDIGDRLSGYISQEEDDEGGESADDESLLHSSNPQKRKAGAEKHMHPAAGDKLGGETGAILDNISRCSSVEEMLRVFLQQQERIEMQWRESIGRHRHERELFELEWQQSMEKLERERLMMEKEWREREEQWKIREEIRAEKMDALLTTLLNKLISEDHS